METIVLQDVEVDPAILYRLLILKEMDPFDVAHVVKALYFATTKEQWEQIQAVPV